MPAKRSDIKVDAVFDIETEDWTSVVFAGLYYSDGDYRVFSWKNINDFFDHLFAIQGDVWAHYGGGFDIKFVLDEAKRRGYHVEIASAGSLIRSAKIRRLTLRDSFALFPASLKDFTSGLGVSKEKLNLPCICGDDCGGYCSIRRDKPQHHERIKTYLRADCESLFAAMQSIREWAEENNVDLRPTVGASAWAYAHRVFDVPGARMNDEDFRFARSAYYGGRVEVFRWGRQQNVFEYDVRSMYPWALHATPLPWGGSYTLESTSQIFNAFDRAKPGAYDVEVEAPRAAIPILPMRTPKRIYYPTGTFRGIFTLPELQYAIERGYTITRVFKALVWEAEKRVFTEWADAVFHQRHHLSGGADSPLGMFNKFRANALTGKLGQNPERWSHELYPERIITCKCSAEPCTCNPHIEIAPGIFKRRTYRKSGCMHPIWAAYLTSVSRIKLHRMLTLKPDACYCDTDSVFALSERPTEKEPKLGDFEFKGAFRECFFAAPKVYTKDGKVKAKGIKAKTLIDGGKYTRRSVTGFGQGMKRGEFFTVTETTRTLNFHSGGRVLLNSAGETRPMTAFEALEDSKKRGIK